MILSPQNISFVTIALLLSAGFLCAMSGVVMVSHGSVDTHAPIFCEFAGNHQPLCPATNGSHISFWESVSQVTPQKLFFLLVFGFFVLVLRSPLISRFHEFKALHSFLYVKELAVISIPDQFRLAFAKGLIQPQLYNLAVAN